MNLIFYLFCCVFFFLSFCGSGFFSFAVFVVATCCCCCCWWRCCCCNWNVFYSDYFLRFPVNTKWAINISFYYDRRQAKTHWKWEFNSRRKQMHIFEKQKQICCIRRRMDRHTGSRRMDKSLTQESVQIGTCSKYQ